MKRSMYISPHPQFFPVVPSNFFCGRAFEFFFALFSEVSTKDETARSETPLIRSGGAGFAV